MYALFLFVLCNFLWYQSGLCSSDFRHFQNIASFNDFDLPENLTTGSPNVRSRLECFITCQKTANCVTIFVRVGSTLECKFSEKTAEELNGQLTKGNKYRCFAQYSESTSDNGNTPDYTTYDHISTIKPLDLDASSSDWSTIDWNESSDMIQSYSDLALSPSEQILSSQTFQPSNTVVPTMDETTIFETSPAFEVSGTTASDRSTITSSFTISSMTSVASTTLSFATRSISIRATRTRLTAAAVYPISVGAYVSPTKSQTVTMSCSADDTSGEDNNCSNGDSDVNVSVEDGSADENVDQEDERK